MPEEVTERPLALANLAAAIAFQAECNRLGMSREGYGMMLAQNALKQLGLALQGQGQTLLVAMQNAHLLKQDVQMISQNVQLLSQKVLVLESDAETRREKRKIITLAGKRSRSRN